MTLTSTARTQMTPTFRELTDQESRSFLSGHNAGRIAYSFHDRVDIQPIPYVVSGN
jgi:nitroimidazol reductase NimA-like FMN-containing flavoprotein (pyridoxamine 5'-phosphate oxidase superfamily)